MEITTKERSSILHLPFEIEEKNKPKGLISNLVLPLQTAQRSERYAIHYATFKLFL
jgi:hypothetical protein